MSLLQKASIITTPTAYAEDYLYSIKPAYALGSELVTNGDFSTDSDWAKTNATISGGKANFNIVGGAYAKVAQSITYVTGRKYRLTAVVNGTSPKVMRFRDDTGNSGGLTSSNGIVVLSGAAQLVELEWVATTSSDEIAIERHTTSGDYTFTVDNVSVKEITDADFDFDRNSTGTRVNEDYLIEDVPYNIFSYSEDFTNSYWSKFGTVETTTVKAPYSTANAIKLIRSTGTYNIIRPQTNIVGTIFTQSIFVKNIDADNFYIRSASGFSFYNFANKTTSSANLVATSAGNGWIKLTTNDVHATFKQFGIGESETDSTELNNAVYIWGAQITKGDIKPYLKTTDRLDIPRIDYTNGEPSILLEPSRTNRFDHSQDFSTWAEASLTVSTSTELSPEGIANAYRLINGTASSQYLANTTLTLTVGVTYTYSVFVKRVNTRWIRIASVSSGASGVWFDLDNGEVGTVNSTAGAIERYPNDWYRIKNTFVASASSGSTLAFIGISADDNSTVAEQNGEFLIYGAQIEEGSYATSIIHTSGSTVTRSADVANNAGNSDLFNDSEGVLYAEFQGLAEDGTSRTLSINNTVSNRVFMQLRSATGQVNSGVVVGGSLQGSSLSHNITQTDNIKMAFKYKANDYALYVNGSEVATQASGSTFSAGTLNDLSFDSGDGAEDFFGKVKSVMVFKEALTDLELEKLTGYNNHELYMNYYNRLSYLGLVEEYNVESDINNYIL